MGNTLKFSSSSLRSSSSSFHRYSRPAAAAATVGAVLILLSVSDSCSSFSSSSSRSGSTFTRSTKYTSLSPSSGSTASGMRRVVSSSSSSTVLNSNSGKPKNNGPFSTLMSDFASSILKGGGVSGSSDLDDSVALDIMAGNDMISWEGLRERLVSQATSDEERNFRSNLEFGYGPPSPLHKVRLFHKDNKVEDVRVTFYRDSASWCPYCQKVWMTLEEKEIPYRIVKVNMRCYGDKTREFLKMQPNGNIPVAEIDGQVYNQSNDILTQLERLFPENKSLSPDVATAPKAQQLLRLERQLFSAWMYWLTGNNPRSRDEFVEVLNVVEKELKVANGQGFFMGDRVTTVDCMFAPFLERMAASLLFYKGFQMRFAKDDPARSSFPHVNKWFDAMETLPSYRLTKSDYYTHCWDLPPQLGGCTYEANGEPYEKAINGEKALGSNAGSWELPLAPHNGGVEPDWEWCGGDAAVREAVERLSHNHENIVKFAARGAGKKGMPPVMAALADPNAVPNEAVSVTVDAVLRVVCSAMLEDSAENRERYRIVLKNISTAIQEKGGGDDFQSAVVDSLAYLRDRVGVPRDMRLPAAQQLRANLNWAIGILLDV